MTANDVRRATVLAVSCSPGHTKGKPNQRSIRLIAGFGVAGDAHAGATVKHRSRVAKDASKPNLRQVHLIHTELRLADQAVLAWSKRSQARPDPTGA
jgi:hypothetical protein